MPTAAREIISFYDPERDALRPPPRKKVSEWADERRILQPGTSRQPGPWSTATTPYLREPMDAYNDPQIHHLVLCFGTQLGKTETLYNILGYIIDLEPYTTLLIYPREEDAKSVSRTRIEPMIEANPQLAAKKPARDDLYQLLEKHFPGMTLFLVGSNSAAALSQKPCRNLIRDEVDKYPDRVGKDADPLSLSEERTKSFWDIRKIVDASSPTLDDRGIWKLLNLCDEVRRYYVPCPFCGKFQKLDFANIQFESQGDDLPTRVSQARHTARLICVGCGKAIGNEYKFAMLAGGKWVVDQASPYPAERLGFHLSSLYSPWLSWGDIAAVFLAAKLKFEDSGEIGDLQRVVNGWFAEPWVQRVKTAAEHELLALRTELPPLVVPPEAIALTAGIDMQKQGFYCTVWAWTRQMVSNLIYYSFLPDWDAVYDLVYNWTFPIQDSPDEVMSLWRAAFERGLMVEKVVRDLKTGLMPLDRLIPYINNTRLHPEEQVKQIMASILEFGFNDPIAVDEQTQTVIEGHGRLEAAKRLGLTEVPVIELGHLSEAQRKAYAIAHNKLTDNSEFNFELLRIELESLQELDFNLDTIGFEIGELEELLGSGDESGEGQGKPEIKQSATLEELAPSEEERQAFTGRKIMVEFSGGKDSTTAALWCLNFFPENEIQLNFVDLGADFVGFSLFLNQLAEVLGAELNVLRAKANLIDEFYRQGKWPFPTFPYCHKYLHEALDNNVKRYQPDEVIVVRGGRLEEKTGRRQMQPDRFMVIDRMKAYRFFNPMYFATKEVGEKILEESAVPIWEGYSHGLQRTACRICPGQRRIAYAAIRANYPDVWQELLEIEKRLGPGCWQPIGKEGRHGSVVEMADLGQEGFEGAGYRGGINGKDFL
ncbi:MAG: terminase gpA endonuclease subunit [Desulfobacteraceae bacterium]